MHGPSRPHGSDSHAVTTAGWLVAENFKVMCDVVLHLICIFAPQSYFFKAFMHNDLLQVVMVSKQPSLK